MLVNCPKCGFSQPQDQYCASCGVDMFAYRPTQKPFLVRLLQNTGFQLVAFILIVAAVFAGINYQEKAKIAARIAEIENASDTQVVMKSNSNTSVASEDQASTAPTADETFASGSEASSASGSGSANESASANFAASQGEQLGGSAGQANTDEAPTAAANDSVNSATSRTTASTPSSSAPAARVILSEAPTALITRILSDAEDTSSNGPYSSGVIADAEKFFKRAEAAGAMDNLDTSPLNPLRVGRPTIVYSGGRDETSNHFLGFAVEITPLKLDDSNYQLQVRVWRSLRYPNATPQIEELEIPVPETFYVPKNGAVIIAGALPRRPIPDSENIYKNNKVLRVLSRETFKSGSHDLVIIIEAR